MNTKERIIKSIKRNPDRTVCDVSKCIDGATAAIVRQVIQDEGLSLGKASKSVRKPRTPAPGGKEAFRNTFSKTVIQRRRVESMHKKIEAAINKDLKEREWIPDSEFREIVGVSMADWSNLRRDYEHLLISDLVDSDRKKYTVWAHPDSIDELRAIANE